MYPGLLKRTASAIGCMVLLAALAACASLLGLDDVTYSSDPDATPGADVRVDDGSSDASLPDGACSPDLQTDPRNCGRCGHDCLGGQCDNGTCQPFFVAVDRDGNRRLTMDLDPTRVYWASEISGRIEACDRSGCARPDDLGSVQRPTAIRVQGASLFVGSYLSDGGGAMYTCPSSGCAGVPSVVSYPESVLRRIELDDGHVLWTDGARVRSVPLDGGPAVNAVRPPQNVLDFAITGGSLYFSTVAPSLGTCRLPCDGGAGDLLVDGGPRADFLRAGDSLLLYSQGAGLRVLRLDAGTDASATYFATNGQVNGVAVVKDTLFWLEVFPNNIGEVKTCDLPACAARTLATGQPFPQEIQADERAVYWVAVADAGGTIMGVAR